MDYNKEWDELAWELYDTLRRSVFSLTSTPYSNVLARMLRKELEAKGIDPQIMFENKSMLGVEDVLRLYEKLHPQ